MECGKCQKSEGTEITNQERSEEMKIRNILEYCKWLHIKQVEMKEKKIRKEPSDKQKIFSKRSFAEEISSKA